MLPTASRQQACISTRRSMPVRQRASTEGIFTQFGVRNRSTVRPARQPLAPQSLPPSLPAPPPIPHIHSGSFTSVFRSIIESIDIGHCAIPDGANAFFVCELGEVARQVERWRSKLANVTPFYGPHVPFPALMKLTDLTAAVKVSPDPMVIRLLASLGLGFDCASPSELSLVLSLGVPPSRIIFANPCKSPPSLQYARSLGVNLMTFDNRLELEKIKTYHDEAALVLRIHVDDKGSSSTLGSKYGAPMDQVGPLLRQAKDLELDVFGLSFHVGSGCSDPTLYHSALSRASEAFSIASELGYDLRLLDIGGGFDQSSFEDAADQVVRGLDDFFPNGREIRVIAEPGRYFVTEAFQLAANVIAKRDADESKAFKRSASLPRRELSF